MLIPDVADETKSPQDSARQPEFRRSVSRLPCDESPLKGYGHSQMKYVLISRDPEVLEQAQSAFFPDDEVHLTQDWQEGLQLAGGADLIFVDLLATLKQENKIAGYEEFAEAKMADPNVSGVRLVLIWPPEDYVLDFMTGYPGFFFQHIQRPVTYQKLRRATTFI